ncbi:hypothetical protein RRG08_005917 [Elysia crispata]|uniref:PDEase domain-containing protein n=1 Tax=Elysia crispata TaxID=231223 RepID=A0AAE0YJI9_9GAST|nr:hypothetical protein RRG08_005917 [Elysia crispata]
MATPNVLLNINFWRLMGVMQWLTDLEVFATLIAALIHDYEHTGTTNNFHINTSSEVALLYNDRSVLENHHISAAFRLVREEEHNILCNLGKEEYREFRSLVIDMVLATDMSFHFQQIKNMKSLLGMPEKFSNCLKSGFPIPVLTASRSPQSVIPGSTLS